VRAGARCPRRRLGIGAVSPVAAVGADELAVQPVHLRAADLALLARGLRSFGCLRLLRLIFAHLPEYTGALRAQHPQPLAGTRLVFRCRAEEVGDAGGAQGLERAVGENLLNLTKRGGQGLCKNPQGREALLELGDLEGELLRAGVEGGEALFQLAGAPGEADDLFREVVSEGGAGAPEPEVRPDRTPRGNESERSANEHENYEDSTHSEAHGITRTRHFTNR
jgi:hypothetical protein